MEQEIISTSFIDSSVIQDWLEDNNEKRCIYQVEDDDTEYGCIWLWG